LALLYSFPLLTGLDIGITLFAAGSLPEALGGIVVAGFLYIVVAIIFRFVNDMNFIIFITTLATNFS